MIAEVKELNDEKKAEIPFADSLNGEGQSEVDNVEKNEPLIDESDVLVEAPFVEEKAEKKKRRGRPPKTQRIEEVNAYEKSDSGDDLGFGNLFEEEVIQEEVVPDVEVTPKSKKKKKKKDPEEYEYVAGEVVNILNYGGAAAGAFITKTSTEPWLLNDEEKESVKNSLKNVFAYYQSSADKINPALMLSATLVIIYLNKFLFVKTMKESGFDDAN